MDFLGISWILSFEMRLINGLRWIFRVQIFLVPFAPWRGFGQQGAVALGEAWGMLKGRIAHRDKPTQISAFPQGFVDSSGAAGPSAALLMAVRLR
ncbi:MAG TPA: hypothetical protein VGG79_19215 [Roseiarcus sp.]